MDASELQKTHELAGKPDPFPDQHENGVQGSVRSSRNAGVDTESEQAFPSLAPSAPQLNNRAANSSWGSGGPRIAPTALKQNLVTDTFTLTAIDLSAVAKDGKAPTLGEIMKQVMSKFKVKVEASSNQKNRQTTFRLSSESGKELEKAKRSLIALISPVVTLIVNAPASTIASIVGPKGAHLKAIRDQTGVRIDIPRRDSQAPAHANGNGVAHADAATDGEDEDEPTIPVTITGAQPSALEAQALLNGIIAQKTAKSTQRVKDIPSHLIPFITARRAEFIAAAGESEVALTLNSAEREITINGDREAVVRVAETIKATIEFLKGDLQKFLIPLPKRQHRLLAGKAVDEIMAKSKCSVVVPRPEEGTDQITVWGNGQDLANGMAAIMQKANSQYIHEFPLPGPVSLSKQLVTYMTRISYTKSLGSTHGVAAYLPPTALLDQAQSLNIDLVGEKSKVDAAVSDLSAFIASLMGGIKEIEIDWLLHRIIQGKNAKKIKQLQEAHNVIAFFPPEADELSAVLLVYDPSSPSASKSPVDKAKHVEEVEKELLKMARDAADVKSALITVDKKWHSAVAGKHGTTLNAIIGEDKTLSIKIGAEAGDASEDVILVRGASSDVDRAVEEINTIVEKAKNDEIDNSFSTEFDISRDYVGRIVGSHGAGVNKLRESLGVRIDFSDEPEEKEKENGKKKKATAQKSHVTIIGRKENVEEAKKRILAQVERLADETTEVLKIPAQYHSSLIGQSGKYVIRMEEKYSVKITFPRENAENGEGRREPLKADEVMIKGGRKGVAGAKQEIVDAVEFEKETNNVIKFTVPSRSIARILGKGGASINEIKDETDAQIDIERGSDETTTISCRGTKKGIAAAKAAIMAIANQVGEEVTVSLTIENKYHRSIIGGGGQGLKDIISRCGGPSDPKVQAGLIRFPRQGDPSDEVRLRGDPALVAKLQAELEKIAADLRDRVILYVDVPNVQHRSMIGRGGQHLNELQNRTGAQIQFPGSRSYHQVGEAVNAADFKDADPANLIKVTGPSAACAKAIQELKASIREAPAEGPTATVTVPLKYHHYISQQGNFFRILRNFGVQVDHPPVPPKAPTPTKPADAKAAEARIDDAEDDTKGIEWVVVPNYEGAQEGDSEWTLKARDQAGLERAQKMIAEAIAQAEKCSSVGFLTVPDRTSFPRIVGSKGANVARLRAETGADITVSRENNTIVIVGSESAVEAAKAAITEIANSSGGRAGGYRRQN